MKRASASVNAATAAVNKVHADENAFVKSATGHRTIILRMPRREVSAVAARGLPAASPGLAGRGGNVGLALTAALAAAGPPSRTALSISCTDGRSPGGAAAV